MLDRTDIIHSTTELGLSEATGWIARAITGTPATIIATLAIAALGFATLQGRFSVRDGARVALGCFILFGAPSIARELMPGGRSIQYLKSEDSSQELLEVPVPPTIDPDPYAGASVPIQ